tara:strand:- start:2659 stop:2838 length:180 start_codon:yes stop_codon:yes gene_type:complete
MESRRTRKAELLAQAEEIQQLTARVDVLERWIERLKTMLVWFDERVSSVEPDLTPEEEE